MGLCIHSVYCIWNLVFGILRLGAPAHIHDFGKLKQGNQLLGDWSSLDARDLILRIRLQDYPYPRAQQA